MSLRTVACSVQPPKHVLVYETGWDTPTYHTIPVIRSAFELAAVGLITNLVSAAAM